MKVLVTGANGQLARELALAIPEGVKLVALGRQELDITDRDRVLEVVERHGPDVIVNAAAYTAVDLAEKESERAHAVNSQGAANVAESATAVRARVIQLSTDYVFDGRKSTPYLPEDPTGPLCVYGASKAEAERRLVEVTNGEALIIRSGWLYSAHGHNFVRTMLQLLRSREEVCVVCDQVGTPTWAKGLASAVWAAVERGSLKGIHHWTDAGVASWYDFAVAIQEEARALGLSNRPVPIRPIRTDEFPTAARRPPYSLLDKTTTWSALQITVLHWRDALRAMLRELKEFR